MGRKEKKKQRSNEREYRTGKVHQVSSFMWPFMSVFAIVTTGLLSYSNTFTVPFVLDDLTSIVANSLVKDFHWVFKPRIIGDASFALNYALHGFDLDGYHLLNLSIHLTNAILVYCLLLITGRTPFFASDAGQTPRLFQLIAFWTSILFVCHPIQTQAVTYLAQRVTSLTTLFYLSALLLYALGRLSVKKIPTILLFTVAALTSAAAMLTKEIAVTLPLVVIAYEFLFFTGNTLRRLAFMVGAIAVSLLVPFSILSGGKPAEDLLGEIDRLTMETSAIPRPVYLFTQLRVIVTYLRLLLFPVKQNLDYDYPLYHSFIDPPVMASAFLILLLLAAAWFSAYRLSTSGERNYRVFRLSSFGLIWFFATLLVESSIFPIRDVIFEHRLYLPSIGFLLAIASLLIWLQEWLAEKHLLGNMVFVVLALAVTVLATATWQRNSIWGTPLTLWEDVVRKSPDKARGHGILAGIYRGLGRDEDAVREYRTAIRLNPKDAAAHNNLGSIYFARREYDNALREYLEAFRLTPGNPKISNNIGRVYLDQGRFAEARQSLEKAVQLAPDYDQALNNLGIVLFNQGKTSSAMEHFRKALNANPNNAEARENLLKIQGVLSKIRIQD